MGSHRSSVRREIRSVERGLRQFQREVGDTVVWYEFDSAKSSGGDTYDEGGIPDPLDPTLIPTGAGLVFKAPTAIPVVWIRFVTPTAIQTEEGEYTVNRTTLRFARDVMRTSGLQNPLDPAAHFNDRYSYNGFLYRVDGYNPRGWIHNTYLMVDVNGTQLKPEELQSDSFPFNETPGTSSAWTPGQQLGWIPTGPPNVQPNWETPD